MSASGDLWRARQAVITELRDALERALAADEFMLDEAAEAVAVAAAELDQAQRDHDRIVH